jgi:hypothetical protein
MCLQSESERKKRASRKKYLYNGGKDYEMVFGYIYQWDSIEMCLLGLFSVTLILSTNPTLPTHTPVWQYRATLKTILVRKTLLLPFVPLSGETTIVIISTRELEYKCQWRLIAMNLGCEAYK